VGFRREVGTAVSGTGPEGVTTLIPSEVEDEAQGPVDGFHRVDWCAPLPSQETAHRDHSDLVASGERHVIEARHAWLEFDVTPEPVIP